MNEETLLEEVGGNLLEENGNNAEAGNAAKQNQLLEQLQKELEAARKQREEMEKKLKEFEARQKADEEAKRKAEEEAKRKAEEEAKRAVDPEAKRKAEVAARRKAEEEAKLQVWKELSKKELYKVNGVSFRMVPVEGGTFKMGNRSVTLSSYMCGETPVTEALWKSVMSEYNKSVSRWKGNNYPVTYVSWYDCQEFIVKLNQITGMNFRLLSEAEWEFAARGGNLSNDYIYSGSDNIDEVAWCHFNGAKDTHEVATKKANELGLYDMCGNVWEWCMDIRNGGNRVIRGGGYNSDPHECRVNYDSKNRDPKFSWDSIGFRLALSDFGLGKSRSSNNSKERSNDTQDTKNKQKESSAKTGMFSFLSKIFKGD